MVAHTWWYTIFGLATLMVIQGVVPDLPDQTLVVEQTIATLWAGVQAVPHCRRAQSPSDPADPVPQSNPSFGQFRGIHDRYQGAGSPTVKGATPGMLFS